MSRRVDEHAHSEPGPGRVSEGGVDVGTGATTGAIAGAALGAAGGPAGVVFGAMIGAVIGGAAAAGPEDPEYPDYWERQRDQLHEHEREGHAPRLGGDMSADSPQEDEP